MPTGSPRRTSFSFLASLPVLLLTLALALGLAGCAKKLNTDAIARRIRELATQQGAAVRSVKCPADVKAQQGATFTCTLTFASGGRQSVLVRQRDDQGRVTITTGGPP